jgi:hypothetical protein
VAVATLCISHSRLISLGLDDGIHMSCSCLLDEASWQCIFRVPCLHAWLSICSHTDGDLVSGVASVYVCMYVCMNEWIDGCMHVWQLSRATFQIVYIKHR